MDEATADELLDAVTRYWEQRCQAAVREATSAAILCAAEAMVLVGEGRMRSAARRARSAARCLGTATALAAAMKVAGLRVQPAS